MAKSETGRERDPHNVELEQTAHRKLSDLLAHAERDKHYGRVGVSVGFESGAMTTVKVQLEGTFK